MQDKINEVIRNSKTDSIFLYAGDAAADVNFYRFSGISKATHSTGYLILKKGKRILLTDPLEYGNMRKMRNISVKEISKPDDMKRFLSAYSGKRIGINCNFVSVNSMKKIRRLLKGKRFVDVSEHLSKSNEIKTPEEIKKIREACMITSEMFRHVENMKIASMREIDVANELEIIAKRLGCEGFSFPPIIAFGKNSAIPHHITGKTRIGKGVLLADIGVTYEGYCSDMTRMFFIGNADDKIKNMYKTVNDARKKSIGIAKSGVKANNVFDAANNMIKTSFGSDMIHGVGHGLGILVHDYPAGIHGKSDFVLKENMCITIEPGYYKKGFGGVRIEDDLVVKKGKPMLLSKAPDEIVEV